MMHGSAIGREQPYLNMRDNNLQNSLHPLDGQISHHTGPNNLGPCQISAPLQLQKNPEVPKTPSPIGQDRISSNSLSDQKGGKMQQTSKKLPRVIRCVVVPMDPDAEPYEISIKIKGGETSMKQVFTEDYYYWTKVFKGYSPIEPPGYSVFRKQVKAEESQNQIIQILLLKCEGHKFPRNPNAHPFELH